MEKLITVLADEGSFLPLNPVDTSGVQSGMITMLSRPVSLLLFSDHLKQNAETAILLAIDHALKTGTPLILCFTEKETIQESVNLTAVIRALVRLSGVCPMLALIAKETGAAAQTIVPYVDFSFYAGGIHERTSSVYQALDLPDAVEKLRTLLHYLPLNCAENAPLLRVDTKHAPVKKYKHGENSCLASLADSASVFEVYPDTESQLSFAHINGRSVGMLYAMQGTLPAHAARFIQFCDCYALPLVIVAEKEFEPSTMQQFVLAQSTVPLIGIGCMEQKKSLFDCVLSPDDSHLHQQLVCAVEYFSVKRDVPAPHKHGNLPL